MKYKKWDLASNRLFSFLEIPLGYEFKIIGWECPVCGRGNAPEIKVCECFREKNKNGRFKSKRGSR